MSRQELVIVEGAEGPRYGRDLPCRWKWCILHILPHRWYLPLASPRSSTGLAYFFRFLPEL